METPTRIIQDGEAYLKRTTNRLECILIAIDSNMNSCLYSEPKLVLPRQNFQKVKLIITNNLKRIQQNIDLEESVTYKVLDLSKISNFEVMLEEFSDKIITAYSSLMYAEINAEKNSSFLLGVDLDKLTEKDRARAIDDRNWILSKYCQQKNEEYYELCENHIRDFKSAYDNSVKYFKEKGNK